MVAALLGGRNRFVKAIDFAVGVFDAAVEVALLAGRNRSISLMDVDCGISAGIFCDAWSRCSMCFGVWRIIPDDIGVFPIVEAKARLGVLLSTGMYILSGVHCDSKRIVSK